MEERNSEGTATKWFAGISLALAALAGLVQGLSDAGLAEYWPFFATLAGFLLPAAKVVGDYIKSRPAKTLALAQKSFAEQGTKSASSEDPTSALVQQGPAPSSTTSP